MQNQKIIIKTNKSIIKLAKDYFLLTKPRVLTLLIFTSVSGAFLAKQGFPNPLELLGLLIGGYCSSGSAATLNMYFETDVDQNMGRTKNRPIAEGTISPNKALVFAIILALASFLSLYLLNNLLAAVLAFLGGFFVVSMDFITRVIFASVDIRVGVLMSLIGGPFFIFLIFFIVSSSQNLLIFKDDPLTTS